MLDRWRTYGSSHSSHQQAGGYSGIRNKAAGLFLAAALLAGCTAGGGAAEAETKFPAALTPYNTATALQVNLVPIETVAPTALPLPTATPFVYVVVENDTLIGIAARFKISLDALRLANPDVNPNILSVGSELVIPPPTDGESGETLLAQPTPVQVDGDAPRCYPTATGGLWCLWLVRNAHAAALENLSARVSLFDAQGEALASQTAFAPLNVLPSGSSLPLVTFFEPPAGDYSDVQAQLVTAIEVREGERRYLKATLENQNGVLAESGLSGQVSGTVLLQDGGKAAAVIWVAAVAYDAEGRVVGVRRWEGEAAAGVERVEFSLVVSSLGAPIARVEALVEARPKK